MAFVASIPVVSIANKIVRRHILNLNSVVRDEHHQDENSAQVVVIGGGAAGHMAAITCARRVRSHCEIVLLESTSSVLSKVRQSGGGRCNVTSALDINDGYAFSANYPRGRHEMLSVVSRFNSKSAMSFFEDEGVALKTEPSGKVFPVSDDSSSVVDALVRACRDVGVRVLTNVRVQRVETHLEPDADRRYIIHTSKGERHAADFVVVATGSARSTWAWAASLGHRIINPVPSLFTFGIDDNRLQGLAGLSVVDVAVNLQVDKRVKRRVPGLSQRGAVIVTHWGLSGPAVLSLSAFGARVMYEQRYRIECIVDWIPMLSLNEKTNFLRDARVSHAQKHVATFCPLRNHLPKRLWQSLVVHVCQEDGFQKDGNILWSSVTNKFIDSLAQQLHHCSFQVLRKGQFKDEFVTSGGVALPDVDTSTFESKRAPRMYFAGETLDVDGRTGGYNLQFAWSSGYIAGSSIADAILNSDLNR